MAIVKDVPEAVDTADTRIYGKNYKTEYVWATNRIAQISAKNDAAAEPIRRKAAMLPLAKFALTAFEIARPALEVYVDAKISKAFGVEPTYSVGAQGDAPTGFGTIKGPSSLVSGNTGTYVLYVGGKKITSGVEWSTAGTSISVYGAGDHARAMAGNPPVKSGRFRTGIRARFNGKSYQKTIQIYK